MEGVDFYRLIRLCTVIVFAWMVQIVGLSKFRRAFFEGPPVVNIVDLEKDIEAGNLKTPLGELAPEKGWDMSASFVTADQAEIILTEHHREKWHGLWIGLAGAIVVLIASYRLWEDWLISIACIITGPMGVAIKLRRSA